MGLKGKKEENDKTQIVKIYLLNVFNGNYIQKIYASFMSTSKAICYVFPFIWYSRYWKTLGIRNLLVVSRAGCGSGRIKSKTNEEILENDVTILDWDGDPHVKTHILLFCEINKNPQNCTITVAQFPFSKLSILLKGMKVTS